MEHSCCASCSNFQLMEYPNYNCQLYCGYEAIDRAVSSWGVIESVLYRNNGTEHLFVVRFTKPINITSDVKAIPVNALTRDIPATPFRVHTSIDGGIILGENKIAFDIKHLTTGDSDSFLAQRLFDSLKLVPDKRLFPYRRKPWSEELEKEMAEVFNSQEKACKLLRWIEVSGKYILEKGVRLGGIKSSQPSTEDIISNYVVEKGWKKVRYS